MTRNEIRCLLTTAIAPVTIEHVNPLGDLAPTTPTRARTSHYTRRAALGD
ncbi:MAG TPA: hypothetical protein VLL08_13260 [Kineosporiaceae bacterium]|nr:hypothetical protein [Kineosporiaceae bacterium]